MSDHIEQRRRKALAKRNEERQILHNMLSEPGRGGISDERAAALQAVFKRRAPSNIPRSERGLAKDESARLEGLAEMAMARPRSSPIEAVEEQEEGEEKDEEKDEEGSESDGDMLSSFLNGELCTTGELEEGDIPQRDIEEQNEQRPAQSTPAPATFFMTQIQSLRAREEKVESLYKEEWSHFRSFGVREQKVEEERIRKKDVEVDIEENNIVEDKFEQMTDVENRSNGVA